MAAQEKSFASQLLLRWYVVLAIALTCAVWVVLALALRPLRDADGRYSSNPYGLTTGLENQATDLLFQLRDVMRPQLRARGPNEPITIIEIDEKSIKDSGQRLQKWERDFYARLIDRANEGGATVIGLDLLLGEQGGASADDRAYDQKLSEAIARAGNVVVANTFAVGSLSAITPLRQFSDGAYSVGFVNIQQDSDVVFRNAQLFKPPTADEGPRFSFATRIAEGYLAANTPEGQTPPSLTPVDLENVRLGERTLRLRNDQTLQVDFRGYTPAFRHISAGEILFNKNAQIPDDLFRNRIVLIGASNIDAPDLFATPFFESSRIVRFLDRGLSKAPVRTPGVELHATAVATILFGKTLKRPHYLWQMLALILPLALASLAIFRLRALWGLVAVVLLGMVTLVGASWAFNAHGLILPLASSWLGLIVLTPVGLGLRYAHERVQHDETEAERAQVMNILERCVSEEVADELWESRDQIMSGERRTVSIIFTDIRNFTTLSESASSDQIVVWLNDYFSRMQAIVLRHRGHINKFIGDGLMIVFGAPASRGDEVEAREAVACGLEMLTAVEKMNKDWEGSGRPVIKIGVGIHTGEATCGVVGAETRLEYTIIGDTVNLSARLESTTKEYGVPLLVSDATARLLDDKYESSPLGEARVKGKNLSTKIFSVKLRSTEKEATATVAAGI